MQDEALDCRGVETLGTPSVILSSRNLLEIGEQPMFSMLRFLKKLEIFLLLLLVDFFGLTLFFNESLFNLNISFSSC